MQIFSRVGQADQQDDLFFDLTRSENSRGGPAARWPIRQKIRKPTHSQARLWLPDDETGGTLLPGQRRTLGGRARNFTSIRANILLADRGFSSFFSIHSLQARGVDSVMCLHQSTILTNLRRA
jgi:hypothetical protein